ncbi:MAG: NifU family protein, partial [Spirochaetota bacterium]
EDDLVCECARVRLSTIQDVIRINDLKTVEEITQYTKAGAFCKSCIRPGGHEKRKYYLEDILKETRAKMELERKTSAPVPFASMTVIQKHNLIETALNAKVRPALGRDGGNVEVLDITSDGDSTLVKIRYSGACSSCASADLGTLSFIEEMLRGDVDKAITVQRG